jgi:hypothetical protein
MLSLMVVAADSGILKPTVCSGVTQGTSQPSRGVGRGPASPAPPNPALALSCERPLPPVGVMYSASGSGRPVRHARSKSTARRTTNTCWLAARCCLQTHQSSCAGVTSAMAWARMAASGTSREQMPLSAWSGGCPIHPCPHSAAMALLRACVLAVIELARLT